jgi:aspartyl-tRNA(Asn)/glutamyl-tRNA(Gln) amidotransferase subunit A
VYDLLLTPTVPTTALPLELPDELTVDGVAIEDRPRMLQPFLCGFNLTGNPAATLPCGLAGPEALPVGLQVVGGHLQDLRVLAASFAFESARPWDRIAPLKEVST